MRGGDRNRRYSTLTDCAAILNACPARGTVAQIMDNFDEIMYNFNHVRESIRTDHVVRLAASGM